jgi:hypothetical protein
MLFYTDRTLLGNDENGDAIVYDWALEPGFFPQVRVEAHRKFVEDNWNVKWLDQEAVKARFNIEKMKYTASPRSPAKSASDEFSVYVIG